MGLFHGSELDRHLEMARMSLQTARLLHDEIEKQIEYDFDQGGYMVVHSSGQIVVPLCPEWWGHAFVKQMARKLPGELYSVEKF
jgi:hypothetical protein